MTKVRGLPGFPFVPGAASTASPLASGQHAAADMMRGATKMQLEMWALSSRRAQAFLELPSRMATCKTPTDLAQEQARFARVAYENYTDAAKRMTQAWMLMTGMPNMMAPFVEETRPAITKGAPEVSVHGSGSEAPLRSPLAHEPQRMVPRPVPAPPSVRDSGERCVA